MHLFQTFDAQLSRGARIQRMDPNRDMLNAIYKMTKENNEVLHSMRRSAFIGGILRFIIYGALIIAPIWFYMAYLNEGVQKMLSAFNQMQTTGAGAQVQFNAFQQTLKDLEAKIPGFPRASSTPK